MFKTIRGKKTKIAPMPGVPRSLARIPKRQEAAELPGSSHDNQPGSIQRASYSELIRDCWEAPPDGEGLLATFIAPPRYGKTRVIREFVEHERKRGTLILAHDPKVPPQLNGINIPQATPAARVTAMKSVWY